MSAPTARETLKERLAHKTFTQPPDFGLQVWRYIDLAKLSWLLSTKRLTLARLDTLADNHEGSLTAKTVEWMKRFLEKHQTQGGWDALSRHFQENQRTTFVSCWHANESESEAMWRLYCGPSGGVAIQTTYQHLVDSIATEHDVYIGLVKYIDYEQDWLVEANAFAPVVHKRLAFAHEREVRMVASPSCLRAAKDTQPPTVLSIPWSCETFAQHIYVSPYAPEYFYEAVQAVVRALAPSLESRLVWSYMKSAPVF